MAGMSHKVADIAVREKFYVPMEAKTAALRSSPFEELLILSTCNRTEVYAADSREISDEELVRYVCSLAGQRPEEFSKFFYAKRGEEAARHLMNVCAGLDSVAMGEDQILHQICRAYETARQLGATGVVLNKLFQSAIAATKRVKTETNLGKLSCNIPFLAMKRIQARFPDLENRAALVVGLGEMGSLMLKYLQENTTRIYAASRTFANAEKFADVLTPVRFEELGSVLGKCDAVVLASACREPFLTRESLVAACGAEGPFPGLVVDLGNPRNAEAAVGGLPGVEYVCVDDLEQVVSENRRLRMVELEAAQRILKEGTEEFLRWRSMDGISQEFGMRADELAATAEEEAEKLLRSMPRLPEEERERIRTAFVRFAKKTANDLLWRVKENCAPEEARSFLACLEKGEGKP